MAGPGKLFSVFDILHFFLEILGSFTEDMNSLVPSVEPLSQIVREKSSAGSVNNDLYP